MVKTAWTVAVILIASASRLPAAGPVAKPAHWPEACPIRPGEHVLFFGDSIVGPGMYSYVMNTLLDRVYPESGVTFHSRGRAMATAQSILPDVPAMIGERPYDWILINFGHNDAGRTDAETFRTEHAPALLREVRKLHKGRIGWISVLGNEPGPHLDEPGREAQAAKAAEGRSKQEAFAVAVRQLCTDEGLLFVPLFEPMRRILDERKRQGLKTAFTMDGVHPNLVGSWVVGGLLFQSLGFTPSPLTVDILPGDVWCDHGRINPAPPAGPVTVSFEGLFLSLRLVPPPERTVRAVPAPAPVVIDGDPAEWGEGAAIRIQPPANVTWELTPRASAQGYAASMRTCHDGVNLYFFFDVSEPDTRQGEGPHELIEVFIDARKDRTTSGNVWRHTPGLTQFLFSRDFSGEQPGNAKAWAHGDASQGEGLKAVARKTEKGYQLEAALPIAVFKQIDIRKEAVPFHWAVSFKDQAFNLDWQGLMSRTGSTFGYGTLELK